MMFLSLTTLLAAPVCAQIAYFDDTVNAGLSMDHDPGPGHLAVMMSGGGTVGDFNNDGWPDIFVPSGGEVPDKLFINNGNGTFSDQAAAWGLTDLNFGVGSAVGDFDNDGWQDLYLCSFGPGFAAAGYNRLYRNNGNSTFTDVAVAAGVNQPSPNNDCYSTCFGDYDLDGDLDLFVGAYVFGTPGNTLFQNNGDGTFTDVTLAAGMTELLSVRGLAPSFTDMNQDGHPDLVLMGDTGTSIFYLNNGDGTFINADFMMPDIELPNGMGLATGDFNNDLDLDFYASDVYWITSGLGGNRIFYSQQRQSWTSVQTQIHECGWAWGAAAVDLENDGDLDLVSTNGWFGAWDNYPTRVFENNGLGDFTEIAATCGMVHLHQGRTLVRLDADRDGDEDLLVTASNGPLTFFRNETQSGNHWLRLAFNTATKDGLAPNGFGTEIYARAGKRTVYRQLDSNQSYLGQSEMVLHLGLAQNTVVDNLDIRWTDGSRTILQNVAADQHLIISAMTPSLSVVNPIAGSTASVSIEGATSNSMPLLAVSLAGPGPSLTPWGDLHVGTPYATYAIPTDANGDYQFDYAIPPQLSGTMLWAQLGDRVGGTFSNPLAVMIQ
jgi:enediyne biosynthesis protein E4